MAGIRKFNHISPERVAVATLVGIGTSTLMEIFLNGEELPWALGGAIFTAALTLYFTPPTPATLASNLGVILTSRTVEGPVIGPVANWWQRRMKKLKRRVVPYHQVDLLASDLTWQKGKDNYLVLKDRERLVLNRILIRKKEFDEIIAAITEAQRRRTT